MSLSRFDRHRRALEAELKEVFASREGLLYDLLRYHLGWVDQRGVPQEGVGAFHFQSILALACCEAFSGGFQAALPAAAGIELVHHFTLVHGDVQAGRVVDPQRPSVWWLWGPAQAINAGDGLHALGRTTIMRLAQRGVPAGRVLRALASLDRACLALCEGQYLDLEFQDQLMVASGAYYDMIRRKTGALAACAAEVGALAGGADDQVCAGFGDLGSRIGMAWQISLDIADLWGQTGDGMTPSNVLNKKKSLPLIYAMETAPVSTKRELGTIYMKRVLGPDDVSRVITILEGAGAREFAEVKARELAQEATLALKGTGLPEERLVALRELFDWALEGQVRG